MTIPFDPSWLPLNLLKQRFEANVKALATRDVPLAQAVSEVQPAVPYYIRPGADQLTLATRQGDVMTLPPVLMSPQQAFALADQFCPDGKCVQPLLICGEDQGWLWNRLYEIPAGLPTAPGHRPPLFFLLGSVERLYVMLHLHDWRMLLADHRVRLFVGPDAFDRFRQSLVDDCLCVWPRLSVKMDHSLWPAGLTMDALLDSVKTQAGMKLAKLLADCNAAATGLDNRAISELFASGQPLKILGITSRYTTFLQYSMRDWLAGFDRLGHTTRLLIEPHDHQVPNTLFVAQACQEFRPDLIVVIDHYRAEMGGMPDHTPVVMWVQDQMPSLFSTRAGLAQGPRDYALGFARLRMIHEFKYPAERYIPAIVGVDETRFAPRSLSADEQARYACDVSFVSHASMPAEAILQENIDRLASDESRRLLSHVFEQLRGVYDAGGMVTEPVVIRGMIDQAMTETRTTLPEEEMPALLELFTHRINNALFRHQSLQWVAEAGVDLRLYGRGWEKHPKLSRNAQGLAEHGEHLATIYRASRINLQIQPHGALHQRLLEGLASGGFFLLRYCPGDVLERHFRTLLQWCRAEGIESDEQLLLAASLPGISFPSASNKNPGKPGANRQMDGQIPPMIQQCLADIRDALQCDPFGGKFSLVETIQSSDADGYVRSAGMVWGDDYDAVAYASRDELNAKLSHYLKDESARRQRAESMRKPVLARFTYTAVCQRLLKFIAEDQSRQAMQTRQAA